MQLEIVSGLLLEYSQRGYYLNTAAVNYVTYPIAFDKSYQIVNMAVTSSSNSNDVAVVLNSNTASFQSTQGFIYSAYSNGSLTSTKGMVGCAYLSIGK